MIHIIRRRIDFLESELVRLEKCIEDAPPGKLRIYTSGNYSRWIVILPNGTSQYLKKSEKIHAEALWQKQQNVDRYYKYSKELVAMKRLQSVLEKLYSSEEKRITRRMNSVVAKDMADLAGANDWEREPYSRNPYYPLGKEKGPLGEMMRSKSEVIIALTFRSLGIPYRYECAYLINGRFVYPDFTIVRPSDHKEVLWEHFGMWDDDGYRAKAISKINEYLRSGLVPYDDFIFSVESSYEHVDMEVIADMVRAHVLS